MRKDYALAMRFLAALLLAVVPAAAADEDPTEVLIRLREQVLAHTERIPNYTCVETIHRDRFESAGEPQKSCDGALARRKQENFSSLLRLATSDRLRLDVALAATGEIYSWAGAAKFEEGEIDELIPYGAMGTGPFAAMLVGVFQGRPPRFIFEGETSLDHRVVYEYSYHVDREDSRYRVKAKREWVVTGYDAVLWVDPKTAELVRLDVSTDELPPATGLCQTDTKLEYGLVQLGNDDYLLPKFTRQRFIEREGSEAENQVTFAACREFRGESTVSFAERRASADAPPEPPVAPIALQAGLPVTIDVLTAIDDKAAAGDRIRGRLVNPIRDAKGVILVAGGAALDGRLMRVEIRHDKHPESALSLRWETIEIDGVRKPIELLPNRRAGAVKTIAGGLRQRGVEIELPPESDMRYGVYRFPGEHIAVHPGLRTEWTTARF